MQIAQSLSDLVERRAGGRGGDARREVELEALQDVARGAGRGERVDVEAEGYGYILE